MCIVRLCSKQLVKCDGALQYYSSNGESFQEHLLS